MTDLFLVRHGETVWHSENRYAGTTDIELTALGLRQAGLLAGWAAAAGLDAVWSSPLSRARRTAAESGARTGLEVCLDPRLRELDFGAAEGLTKSDMATSFPAELAAFHDDPVAHHLPDGEDPDDAAARFVTCLEDIAAEHPEGRVLVVAHTTAIRLAVCRMLGIPLGDYRRVFPAVGNCALTQVRLHDGQASILQFNTPIGDTSTGAP